MPYLNRLAVNKKYTQKLSISKKRTRSIILGGVIGCFSVALVAFAVQQLPRAMAAPALASGFTVKSLPTGHGSFQLTDFSYTPDGGYFTTGKSGLLNWVSASGQVKAIAQFNVVDKQDLGLNDVTLAHNYETSKTIYTIRSLVVNSQTVTRLSAWTVTGSTEPTGLASERTVLQIPVNYPVHGMTDVVAAEDGTLWVTSGDSSEYIGVDEHALKSLDVNEGYGKLLHITPDGRGVASNPYYDGAQPASWKSRVYAMGFRSPFRMSLDPKTGAPVVGDVGFNSYEEVNLVRPGASYGWPCWEGKFQTPGYKDLAACKGVGQSEPLWSYHHDDGNGTSVTGGVVYTGNSYPEQYRGALFFGDYTSQKVWTLKYDDIGNLTRPPESTAFAQEYGRPVKFSTASNGDVVYADIGGGQLKRLIYVAGNRAPTAKASIVSDPSTRTVAFDGSASSDLDEDALTYSWNFGDGTTATGVEVQHTYAAPGTDPMTATLTVTDTQGASNTASYTVVPANNTPKITMTTPGTGRLFKVGDIVDLTATANDAEDGTLDIDWQSVLVHCSGGYCHDHPGEASSGASYSQVFTDHGDNTYLEVTARATDSYGVISEETYVAAPKLRTLTIESSTPSAVTVNGVASASTQITVGGNVGLMAPVTASDGVATFSRWSDGVTTRERSITMPDTDLVMSVDYATPIDRRYDSEAALRTTLGAAAGTELGDANLRYRDYEKGRLYWTPRSGVHEIHGGIYRNYLSAGAHVVLGEPTTDELITRDGAGRYNKFYGTPGTSSGAIYWSPNTGSARVYGAIYQLWVSMGAENGKHGYPTNNESAASKDGGRYNSFENGRIYWKSSIGARSVHGAIHHKWQQLGYEAGFLGFPLTNELATADGAGRYNKFEGGSVYWSSKTGAHEVHGAIRARWESIGAENSYLGYPTTDEYKTSTGSRSSFQNGYITWNSNTRQTYIYRY